MQIIMQYVIIIHNFFVTAAQFNLLLVGGTCIYKVK